MKFANPSKRDRTLASTSGHSIAFPGRTADGKLTFVHVPPVMVAEAIAAGLDSEHELQDADVPKGPVRPADPATLHAAVTEAFDLLVSAGEREDFAGNGSPKPAAVEKLLGWKLEAKEIREMWPAYQAAQANR